MSGDYVAALNVFEKRMFAQNRAVVCSIADALDDQSNQSHNCLGCNFDDMIGQVRMFLSACASDTLFSAELSFSLYMQMLNVIWERISEVLNLVGFSAPHKHPHFSAFRRIRLWANFFKHPRIFTYLAHHPRYVFDDPLHRNMRDVLILDEKFLMKYYVVRYNNNGEKYFDDPTDRFNKHKGNVLVIFPDVETLTNDVCISIERFVEMIIKNKKYKKILREKATITDYYATLT